MTRTLTAQAIATCDRVTAMARGKHVPEPKREQTVMACAHCMVPFRQLGRVMHHRGGEVVCTTCVRGM